MEETNFEVWTGSARFITTMMAAGARSVRIRYESIAQDSQVVPSERIIAGRKAVAIGKIEDKLQELRTFIQHEVDQVEQRGWKNRAGN